MNVDDIISRIRRGEDSVTQFKRQAISNRSEVKGKANIGLSYEGPSVSNFLASVPERLKNR